MIFRRLLVGLASLLLLCAAVPAQAQKTKAQLNAEITANYPDNSVGAITPAILRTVTADIVNAIMPTAPVVSGNLACFNGTTGLLQDCGSAPATVPLTIGTTPIGGGTTTRVLFDNAGLLGEYAISGTGSVCMTTSCVMTTPNLGIPSAGVLTNATGLPTTALTGALQAAQEPAHTGDMTNSAASLATTVLKTNGVAFTAGATAAAGQLPGTATNDSASSGNVGEYIEGVIASGSAISVASTTAKTVASISLGAGDWDISGNVSWITTGTTSVSGTQISLSGTTNVMDQAAGKWNGRFFPTIVPGAGSTFGEAVGPFRMSLTAGPTSIFLVQTTFFSASTLTAYGTIRARRVR